MIGNPFIAKQKAVLDTENHRFVISPLGEDGTIGVPQILRVIKRSTNTTWRALAKFTNLRQSDVFRFCYGSRKNIAQLKALKEFVVIDVDGNRAYFYDFEHKPAGVLPQHEGPQLICADETPAEITALIPSRVLTHYTVKDPQNRILTMTLTPTNGYLLGIKDVTLAEPNVPYQVAGTASSLNQVLDRAHFVAVAEGSADVIIAIDDGEGQTNSVVSTTCVINALPGEEISIPTMSFPASITATKEMVNTFDPIVVEDADGKILEFRIAPFGCNLVLFKDLLLPLQSGFTHTITGRPETINDVIANVAVVPTEDVAYIGVELVCDKTMIREYIKVEVSENTSSEESTDTPVEEPVEEPVEATTVELAAPSQIEGVSGAEVAFEATFSGNATDAFEVTFTVDGCGIYGFASDPDTIVTGTHTATGTIDELNAEMAGLKVVVDGKDGSVTIAYGDAEVVVPVTVITE